MANLSWKLLPMGLLLVPYGLLRMGAGVQAGPGAEAGIRQDLQASQEPVEVQLSELVAAPLNYLGQRVSFVVQFDAVVERWNPLMTRFDASQWGSFSAWPDDQFTWHQRVYERPFTRLYFPKGGVGERLIAGARRFERFKLTATLRELLLDEAWIEVERLEPLFELVDEGCILHVSRGLEFALNGQLHLAKEQFERARTAPLPFLARKEIERLIQQCR